MIYRGIRSCSEELMHSMACQTLMCDFWDTLHIPGRGGQLCIRMTITLSSTVFPSGQTGEPAALAPLPGDSTEGQRLLRRQKVQISNNAHRTFVSQQVYVHMCMYHICMYQSCSFLMSHHEEMIYLKVLLLEG